MPGGPAADRRSSSPTHPCQWRSLPPGLLGITSRNLLASRSSHGYQLVVVRPAASRHTSDSACLRKSLPMAGATADPSVDPGQGRRAGHGHPSVDEQFLRRHHSAPDRSWLSAPTPAGPRCTPSVADCQTARPRHTTEQDRASSAERPRRPIQSIPRLQRRYRSTGLHPVFVMTFTLKDRFLRGPIRAVADRVQSPPVDLLLTI